MRTVHAVPVSRSRLYRDLQARVRTAVVEWASDKVLGLRRSVAAFLHQLHIAVTSNRQSAYHA